MKSCFDRRLIFSVVAIVIVVVLAFMIYRNKFQTQEERDANKGKLWGGIILSSIAAVLVIYLLMPGEGKADMDDGGEYGVWDTFKGQIKAKQEERKAYREAKKGGASEAEAIQARREAKWRQKEVKVAGQQAAFEAEQAVRAKQAAAGK